MLDKSLSFHVAYTHWECLKLSDYGIPDFKATEVSRLLRTTQIMSLVMFDRDLPLPIS